MKRARPLKTIAAGARLEQGFSLVELLVVLAILAVITGMVVPAVTSLLASTNLAQGGETVADQIAMARQYASTRNTTTEVRLIKAAGASSQGYNAVQLWTSGTGGGAASSVGKIVYLPQAVAISESSTSLSKMLSLLTVSGSMNAGSASNVPYKSFSIRPSGAIAPVISGSSRSNLYLTVVPARLAGTANTTLPPNYATIQINPDTGNALLIRP